jgi:hypothetical protein
MRRVRWIGYEIEDTKQTIAEPFTSYPGISVKLMQAKLTTSMTKEGQA